VVFAQWNFNSASPDNNTSTGTTTPVIGSGTASLAGGTTATFATGDNNLDPAYNNDNSAWNTTAYPAASVNNKTAGAQFAVSTAGRQNIVVSWSQQSSKTGGKYFRLQYSTNSGTSFADFSTAETLTLATNYYAFTNSLVGLPGVDNNSSFVFRIVGEFRSTATGSGSAAYLAAQSGSTYATSGTTRFDMVTVSGTTFVPAAPAQLASPVVGGGQFGFTVQGSVGANYVVQTATNLDSTNWLPVFTNVSPFTFGDTNVSAPQKFYRAVPE
jgi:hypothetical protein